MTKTTIMQSVIFPTIGTFPTVLNFNTSIKEKANIDGKKILFILDGTGSMGEFINHERKTNKAVVAKKIIEQVLTKRKLNGHDIMIFNNTPKPLCKVNEISDPEGSTYFSPLVDELKKVLTNDPNYCAVVFMSDGLPSEPLDIARTAITTIGNISREMACNPVAVAVGSDADGESCELFAGNRGYNCFIKFEKNIEEIVEDISNGIDCKYEMLENGTFIAVEADGKYYFVDNNKLGETVPADKFLIEKYLNLVIMKYITNADKIPMLKSLVDHCSKLIDDKTIQKEIVDKFSGLLEVINKSIIMDGKTPGMMSSCKQAYRGYSKQI
jgi:hypothetical protein